MDILLFSCSIVNRTSFNQFYMTCHFYFDKNEHTKDCNDKLNRGSNNIPRIELQFNSIIY